MGPTPEVSGNHEGIDPLALPPGVFIAAPVQLAMVQPADRDGEAVADLAPHRPLLGKPEVVGVRGAPAADETPLSSHEPEMVAIALPHRLANGRRRLSLRFGPHGFAVRAIGLLDLWSRYWGASPGWLSRASKAVSTAWASALESWFLRGRAA